MVEQDYLIYEDYSGRIHIIPLESIVKKVIGIYDETHIKAIRKALDEGIVEVFIEEIHKNLKNYDKARCKK